jgi:CubicO group peptidase (beta-lactamase class C family)
VLEGFDENGRLKLRAAKRPITLQSLLTHTAGFTYDLFNANAVRYEEYAQVRPSARERTPRYRYHSILVIAGNAASTRTTSARP